MIPFPVLFLSDSPTLQTGLARISRDLAARLATLPQFRVGFLGRGGLGTSRYLSFPVYSFPESGGWGQDYIQEAWEDFAGSQRGAIFSVWDATRLLWLANPQYLPECPLRDFLNTQPFDLWGYFPVDATAPGGGLSQEQAATIGRYQRVMAYSRFGKVVIETSLGREVGWAPHGIDMDVFTPHPKSEGIAILNAKASGRWKVFDGDIVIGVVAINQVRKDWGLVAATCAHLRAVLGARFKAWWHTDTAWRQDCYNLPALAADFGLGGSVLITQTGWPDAELATAYSGCDVTLVPGMEGFGYPIVESLACGVPVVTGSNHGGSELVGSTIDPIASRIEGQHNLIRMVHHPEAWSNAVRAILDAPPDRDSLRRSVAHLDWGGTLWDGVWRKVFESWLP